MNKNEVSTIGTKRGPYAPDYQAMMNYREMARANDRGDIKAYEYYFNELSKSAWFKNAFNNYANKHYGYYGVAEMEFIYDDFSREEYDKELLQALKKSMRKIYSFNLPELPSSWNADWSDANSYHMRHLCKAIANYAKEWGTRMTVERASSRYPGLTVQLCKMYVRMRKWSEYNAEITMTNDEIVNAFWNATSGKLFSWETINHLKEIFGYTPEPEYSENYIQKKAQIKTAKKEAFEYKYRGFVNRTKLAEISDSKLKSILDKNLTVIGFDENESKVIKRWFMNRKHSLNMVTRLSGASVEMIKKFGASGSDLLRVILKKISDCKKSDPFLKNMATVCLDMM